MKTAEQWIEAYILADEDGTALGMASLSPEMIRAIQKDALQHAADLASKMGADRVWRSITLDIEHHLS